MDPWAEQRLTDTLWRQRYPAFYHAFGPPAGDETPVFTQTYYTLARTHTHTHTHTHTVPCQSRDAEHALTANLTTDAFPAVNPPPPQALANPIPPPAKTKTTRNPLPPRNPGKMTMALPHLRMVFLRELHHQRPLGRGGGLGGCRRRR